MTSRDGVDHLHVSHGCLEYLYIEVIPRRQKLLRPSVFSTRSTCHCPNSLPGPQPRPRHRHFLKHRISKMGSHHSRHRPTDPSANPSAVASPPPRRSPIFSGGLIGPAIPVRLDSDARVARGGAGAGAMIDAAQTGGSLVRPEHETRCLPAQETTTPPASLSLSLSEPPQPAAPRTAKT